MPNTHTPVKVTQADREAAASLWIYVDGDIPTPAIMNEAERYRQGVYDHTPAVQSFAHHRIEATRAAAPELLEALKAARAALHFHYVEWDGEPEDAVPLQLARAKCDAAITKAEAGS